MKKTIIFGLFASILLLAVGVYAHSEENGYYRQFGSMMGYYGEMHEEVNDVLESGNYEDLENLRKKYNMPVMYWIDSEEELENQKPAYDRRDNYRQANDGYIGGGCHGYN